ncbi:MAG TPA: aspartate-semialdehyde dehydrogenase, partial [Tepidisphaeraceae bacterium]|nr:aspartate-semialdehyde dehydrogenase [Tepidisphaeraceae bacterium]
LPGDIAGDVEEDLARGGFPVISNSSPHRMADDVPLMIPEINAEHLRLLRPQRRRRGGTGYIVTNPNCSTIGLALALAPLHKLYGVTAVLVVTMQAISGAGYPGVPSLDIQDNVIPHIGGEEEKMERETRKILGRMDRSVVRHAPFKVSAHCNRVPVVDGHLESVSVSFEKKADPQRLIDAWSRFKGKPQELNLPSAPASPIVYQEAPDRPQPRLDREAGKGMAVTVGRLRPCGILDYKFTLLSHNTIRGAAGAALLNAELLKAEGYL